MPSEQRALGRRIREYLKELGTDLSKRALLHVGGAVLGILLTATLGRLAQNWFNLDHTPTLDEYPGLAWRALVEVWTVYLSSVYTAFWRHPLLGVFCLALSSFAVILYVSASRAKRRIIALGIRLDEIGKVNAIIARSGLVARWPHARPNGGADGASWDDLRSEIARRDNTYVNILGANGAETFGRPTAPLHDALARFQHPVRVILAHPDSDNIRARAADIGVAPDLYRAEINESVDQLRRLRQRGHRVTARLYHAKPNWKMIITTRTMWVQYYDEGTHVAELPVYRFDAGGDLYHCFAKEFERIWERCAGDEVNL
jgi:hypothetical protein